MVRRIVLTVLSLAAIGVLALAVLAWRPSIAPIEVPAAASFAAPVVAKGEMLAGMGDCANCHTAKGGAEYAGGLGLDSGFGVIYSTNITPDKDTGIGGWSEEAFARAMREGVARDGSQLFPAFPYTHFTKASDEDIQALYAFFMTRTPVKAEEKKNELPFPLNVRALQAGWKLLFFDKRRFESVAAKGDEWNRGAYLAESLGHCSACHTPRNVLGAEKKDSSYAGAVIDGWYAPALNAASKSPIEWTAAHLYAYLRTGASIYHGVAIGSMSDVVHKGLASMPDADVKAIAVYFDEVNGTPGSDVGLAQALTPLMAHGKAEVHAASEPGADLYLGACVSCHYNGGTEPHAMRPELALSSTVTGPDPTNLIRIVLQGVGSKEGLPDGYMPGYSASFSDADIATLAGYLRRTRTSEPEWKDLPSKVVAVRKQLSETP